MRPFLLKFSIRLVQLGVFFLILSVTSLIGRNWEKQIWNLHNFNYGGTNLRLGDFLSQCNTSLYFDAIFLGRSTAYRSIDTSVLKDFGITSFNMGSSQQPIENSNRLVQWISRKNCSPKIYFLDLNQSALSCDGFESTYDFIMANNYVMDREFGLMAWDRHDPYLMITWLYYSLRRSIRPAITSPPDFGEYISGGFIYSNHLPGENINCKSESVQHYTSKTLLAQIENLNKTIHHAGSQLRFIIPPSPCNVAWNLSPEMDALTIDGNEWPLAKCDSLYYDNVHLRGIGAKEYSRWLASKVELALNGMSE